MYEHVDKIIAEIGVALNKRVATNKKHSAQGSTLPMQHSELAALRKTIKGYKRCLLSLHRAINKKSKVGIQVARKRIDDSFDARLCAVLRSTSKKIAR